MLCEFNIGEVIASLCENKITDVQRKKYQNNYIKHFTPIVLHLLQEMILLENVYHYIKMDYSIYKQFE